MGEDMPLESMLIWGFIVLPIPIGVFWILIYKNRSKLGLPDWLSGILAQGIISGHQIKQGRGQNVDYAFIIISTIVSVIITVLSCNSLLALGNNGRINIVSNPESPQVLDLPSLESPTISVPTLRPPVLHIPTFPPPTIDISRLPTFAPSNYLNPTLTYCATGFHTHECGCQLSFSPGDQARLTGTLNLHNAPSLESEIIGYLSRDDTVTVLDGPICESSQYPWWQVQTSDGQIGWAKNVPLDKFTYNGTDLYIWLMEHP
jgi:hypothetical protein